MEIMLTGKFGNSYGWRHQIGANRRPVLVDEGDGPFCCVYFYKR